MATLHVRGRLESIFEAVLKRFGNQGFNRPFKPADADEAHDPSASEEELPRQFTLDDEDKYRCDASPIKPQRLMRELPNIFPANTHYLADVGASFSWATHY